MLKSSSTTQPNGDSQSTLLTSNYYGNMDVVVYGTAPVGPFPAPDYVAVLMVGLTPAIEGSKASSPEAALRKLLQATAELLKEYIPKVGAHQRAIHGGGVFDEDMISAEIIEAQRKGPAA